MPKQEVGDGLGEEDVCPVYREAFIKGQLVGQPLQKVPPHLPPHLHRQVHQGRGGGRGKSVDRKMVEFGKGGGPLPPCAGADREQGWPQGGRWAVVRELEGALGGDGRIQQAGGPLSNIAAAAGADAGSTSNPKGARSRVEAKEQVIEGADVEC